MEGYVGRDAWQSESEWVAAWAQDTVKVVGCAGGQHEYMANVVRSLTSFRI